MSGTISFEDAMRETTPAREGAPASAPATISFEDAMGGGNGWLPTAVIGGVSDLVGAIHDIPEAVRGARRSLLEWGAPSLAPEANRALDRAPTLSSAAPGSERVAIAIHGALGVPVEHAESNVGKLGESAVRFATGSALPIGGAARGATGFGARVMGMMRGAGRNAAEGAASGVVSEGAGQATEGTSMEGAARVAGALAPAGARIAAGAISPNLRAQTVKALNELTPQQADAAQKLMEDAAKAGTPITVPEAVQGALGQRVDSLAAVQDFVQQGAGGREVMSRFNTNRDAGARALAQQNIATAAGAPPTSGMQGTGRVVQDAAEAELSAARFFRSQTVKPLYDSASQAAAQPHIAAQVGTEVADTLARLDRIAAQDQTGLIGARTKAMRDSLQDANNNPIQIWESIQDARRYIRDVSFGNITADRAVDKKVARIAQNEIRGLTQRLHRIVPELRRADGEYQRLTREIVDPMETGVVGRMSRTEDVSSQRQAMFPQSPEGGPVPRTPGETATAMGQIAGTNTRRGSVPLSNPEAARTLLYSELSDAFNYAEKPPKGASVGPVGPAFANRIAGTPTQRANLRAAFTGLPGGGQAWEGFNRMLDIFDAQAFRPGTGSQTFRRGDMAAEAERGGIAGTTRAITNPLSTTARMLDRMRQEGGSREMANLMTTPEGFQMLRTLSRVDDATSLRILGDFLSRAERVNQADDATDR